MKTSVVLTAALSIVLFGCGKDEDPVGPIPDPVSISTAALPDAVQGLDYGTQTLLATGGDGSYAWDLTPSSGALPAGLTLAATGAISGTPTSIGDHSFTVRATSGGLSGEKALSIEVFPLLEIATTSLPDGVQDVDYGVQSLVATGGTGSYGWALASTSGPLPAGLSISGGGDVTGTPTAAAVSTFTVEVTSGAQTAQRALSITIDPPPTSSRIVFTRNTSATGYQIFAMDDDGGNETQLTTPGTATTNIRPAQSADGAKIAYVSHLPGTGAEIFVMGSDGTNPVNLTSASGNQLSPEWSPDGTKIVYDTDELGSYNTEVYVMNSDGSNPQRLTDDPSFDGHPDWSPDGSKIAFQTNRDGNYEIYLMDADGSNLVNLTMGADDEFDPTWSPDGAKIAFTRLGDIYVMDADGTNVVNVTSSAGAELAPTWSPDGLRLAFTGFDDGNGDIFVIDLDGSNRTNLTSHPDRDDLAAWAR